MTTREVRELQRILDTKCSDLVYVPHSGATDSDETCAIYSGIWFEEPVDVRIKVYRRRALESKTMDRLFTLQRHNYDEVVNIVAVFEDEKLGGVLVMEQIETLRDLSANQGSLVRKQLAFRVLSEMRAPVGWFARDLKPRNAGISRDNRLVLIDLEQLAPCSDSGRFGPSRFHRTHGVASPELEERLEAENEELGVSRETAHDYMLECILSTALELLPHHEETAFREKVRGAHSLDQIATMFRAEHIKPANVLPLPTPRSRITDALANSLSDALAVAEAEVLRDAGDPELQKIVNTLREAVRLGGNDE